VHDSEYEDPLTDQRRLALVTLVLGSPSIRFWISCDRWLARNSMIT